MKRIIVYLIIGILLFSVVGIAEAKQGSSSGSGSSGSSGSSGGSSSSSGTSDSADSEDQDDEISDEETVTTEQTVQLLDQNQNQIKVQLRTETKEETGKIYHKIKVQGIEAVSDIALEEIEGKIKAKLSNGNHHEIKIMPDAASEIALEELATESVEIELIEVGEGDDLSIVYEAVAEKEVKLFGLFRMRERVTAMINAKNGEMMQIRHPWWHFLVPEEPVVEEPEAEEPTDEEPADELIETPEEELPVEEPVDTETPEDETAIE